MIQVLELAFDTDIFSIRIFLDDVPSYWRVGFGVSFVLFFFPLVVDFPLAEVDVLVKTNY